MRRSANLALLMLSSMEKVVCSFGVVVSVASMIGGDVSSVVSVTVVAGVSVTLPSCAVANKIVHMALLATSRLSLLVALSVGECTE